MMTMIQFIQKECDRQAREIFQHFRENRDFDHKVINCSFCLSHSTCIGMTLQGLVMKVASETLQAY